MNFISPLAIDWHPDEVEHALDDLGGVQLDPLEVDHVDVLGRGQVVHGQPRPQRDLRQREVREVRVLHAVADHGVDPVRLLGRLQEDG